MSFLDYFRQPENLVNFPPERFEEAIQKDDAKILDVRTLREYNNGHISGVKHLPLSSLKTEVKALDKDSNYFLICATGHRSRAAAALMIGNGIHNIGHLEGGMRAWVKAGKKTVTD